jgi:3-hydroxyacyl-CoA dehydrogenase
MRYPTPDSVSRHRGSCRFGSILRLADGACRDRLTFTPNLSQAVATADFVQENSPERPEIKIKLFAEMDQAAPAESILASSSSSITMDVIQSECKRPERCVMGHPFNPPHIVPLVEVVGGAQTSDSAIDRAMTFYTSIGKRPIRLRRAVTWPRGEPRPGCAL